MTRTRAGLLACFVLPLVACTTPKADAVIIVREGGASTVMGAVEFVRGPSGFRPNVWKPGNVLIFRANEQFGDEKGEAGFAYRVGPKNKLERVGRIDLTKTDEELAARYGVKAGRSRR